jgi:hypothetical protein
MHHTRRHSLKSVVLAIATAVASSSSMMSAANAFTSYQTVVTCPVGGQSFTATMMGSFFQSGMRLDFKPIGALIAPYPYPVCPANGFVVYRDNFSDAEIDAISAIVLSDDYRAQRTHNTDYFMIAYVKERLGADSYEIGSTYLRASWEAERVAPDLVDRYRKFALEAFDTFLNGKETGTEKWWTAAVLAVEMHRLLGEFKAVQLRTSVLPLSELRTTYPDLRDVLAQIRMHANQLNSSPEEMRPLGVIRGTIGLGPSN